MKISLALIILILAATYLPASQAKIIERIVAIVNDDIVTESDIVAYKRKLKQGGLVDETMLKLGDPKLLLKDRKALVNHIIDEKIIDSEVRKKDLEVTIERVEKEIRTITKRNGLSRAQLKQALADKGVKFSDYQDFVKTTLQRQSLIEKDISSKIKVSDQDIAAFYAKKKGNSEVYQYKLAHILFLPKNGGKTEAKQRAEKVLKKVGKSQSFEKLAEQFSEDRGFSKGGLLGSFKSGELSKEMEASVRNLTVGDTTKIVPSRTGYHIIKLLDKQLVVDPELESKKEQFRAILFASAFKKQFRTWLDQKREEAFVKMN